MLTGNPTLTVTEPSHPPPYGTGHEAQLIRRDHPEWAEFDPTSHPERKELLQMVDQNNLTVTELKSIADLAATESGIPKPGRPHIRRKAGMAEWIVQHWESVRKVVRDGKVHLEPRKEGKQKMKITEPENDFLLWVSNYSTRGSDRFDEEGEEFINE
jgi:hypothetical protein